MLHFKPEQSVIFAQNYHHESNWTHFLSNYRIRPSGLHSCYLCSQSRHETRYVSGYATRWATYHYQRGRKFPRISWRHYRPRHDAPIRSTSQAFWDRRTQRLHHESRFLWQRSQMLDRRWPRNPCRHHYHFDWCFCQIFRAWKRATLPQIRWRRFCLCRLRRILLQKPRSSHCWCRRLRLRRSTLPF